MDREGARQVLSWVSSCEMRNAATDEVGANMTERQAAEVTGERIGILLQVSGEEGDVGERYFDLFSDAESLSQWSNATVKDEEVLLAVYSYEDYQGSAFLLFERTGELYEAHDYHCSCYGLDNWEPEKTTWEALAMRDYSQYGKEFDESFKKLVRERLATRGGKA